MERAVHGPAVNRGRAILALDIGNEARASELLGVRGVDVDWGDQLVRVKRKGTQVEQWLPSQPGGVHLAPDLAPRLTSVRLARLTEQQARGLAALPPGRPF